jgi:peptidoglycan/xylan/chitin deacetylase (PgdA/CDA1 family)
VYLAIPHISKSSVYSEVMRCVVNVCFHGIGTPRRTLEPGEAEYWITTYQFHRILDLLTSDTRTRISFDDGNVSDLEAGLPALVDRGLAASFFVLAGRLDQPGSLSSEDVKSLVAQGMTVGSHGMDHRPWRNMDSITHRRELVEARSRLSAVTGTTVDEVALPLGRYDRRLLRDLRHLGYSAVHTSDRLWAREGHWLQPRFSVRHNDTVDSVRQQILGSPSLSRRLERAGVVAVKRWR